MVGFLSLIYKKNEMKALMYDVAEVWPTDLGGNKIKEEIKKNWLRPNAVVFLLSIVAFYTPALILTLYDQYANDGTVFVFPFKMYYFCQNNTTLYSYLLVFVFEIIFSTCLHMLVHAPCNLMLTILTCNISMMMRWLQIDLENVLEVSDGRAVFDEDKLKNIVKVHQKLLRLCEKLNECFGIAIFVSVVSSSLIIGFLAFLTLAIDKKYIVATFVISFEMLNLSWPGQLLADMSYDIAEAAYRTQWYDADLKFKKFIYIIILRSQKPAQLSVLGFTNLTLRVFAKVLSSAWSYLSILNCAYASRN
ncbi:odorant receptor 85b-like [Hyposmocoma kahamanoa]|uniref:odorant receptor 85b-like n=1 Tax=Hyposmocoma kahamanoa TaxID=1477025 RepID=UPI000E6D67A4|nr:odorant receptor 85b-like [Hyposmocoma kahamanoa]